MLDDDAAIQRLVSTLLRRARFRPISSTDTARIFSHNLDGAYRGNRRSNRAAPASPCATGYPNLEGADLRCQSLLDGCLHFRI